MVTLQSGPRLFQPVVLRDRFVSNGYFPRHTLTVVDTLTRIQRHLVGGRLPVDDSLNNLVFRVRVNRNRAAVDPSHRRLVLAYQAINRLDIYDSVPALRGSIAGPRKVAMSFSRVDSRRGPAFTWTESNERAYVGVDASQDHIFALFCGKCGPELARIVHVFTWEGRFIREFVLDQGVLGIAVSPDGTTLFGATEEPFPAVVLWNLPTGQSYHH